MEMNKFILLTVLAVFTLNSCKTRSSKNHTNKTKYSFEFGEYGGFTGAKTTKIMGSDGKVYQLNPSISGMDSIFMGELSDSLNSKLVSITNQALNFQNIKESGNLNSYLNIYLNDSLIREHHWPQGKKDLPAEIAFLYQMMNEVKK